MLLPFGVLLLSFGVANLQRCWSYTMGVAQSLNQLGGAAKAVEVAQGFQRFLWSRPYLVVAALVIALVYTRWPRVGRALLALLPFALWLAGQRRVLDAAGFVIVYAFLAPYLYLFVPQERREAGAKLLYWVWAPAVIAGAMTAFTSAAGYVNSPVGLLPALIASGVFLAWALEAVARRRRPSRSQDARRRRVRPSRRRPAVASLPAHGSPWRCSSPSSASSWSSSSSSSRGPCRTAELTKRCDFGPWWGITLTPERHDYLRAFAADLQAQSRPGDQLLVFYQACGHYLFWNGPIAANSYWLSSADRLAPLPAVDLQLLPPAPRRADAGRAPHPDATA